MSDGIDWDHWAARQRGRCAARLRGGGPWAALTAQQAFSAVVTASAPFRDGSRFRALPDVRFFVGRAVLGAPGELLPGEHDHGVDEYVRRVESQLPTESFQLRVEQPLFIDYPLWSSVRNALAEPIARIGTPVLPIGSELSVFPGGELPGGAIGVAHQDTLLLVLHGALRLRCWIRRPADGDKQHPPQQTLEGEAGDLLYVPAGHWSRQEYTMPSLMLRLSLPSDGGRAVIAVKDVIADLIDARFGEDEQVPYLGYPPRPRGKAGNTAPIQALSKVGHALTEIARGEDAHRALQAIWARRVSACALEPVPAPRHGRMLQAQDRIRPDRSSPLVRMPVTEDAWLWAINGRAFIMPAHPQTDRLVGWLSSDDCEHVAALCGASRRGKSGAGMLGIVQKLYDLRAVMLEGVDDETSGSTPTKVAS